MVQWFDKSSTSSGSYKDSVRSIAKSFIRGGSPERTPVSVRSMRRSNYASDTSSNSYDTKYRSDSSVSKKVTSSAYSHSTNFSDDSSDCGYASRPSTPVMSNSSRNSRANTPVMSYNARNSRAGTPVRNSNSDNSRLSNPVKPYIIASCRTDAPIRFYQNPSIQSKTPVMSYNERNIRAGTPDRYINSEKSSISYPLRKNSSASSLCDSPIRYYENTSSRSTTPVMSYNTFNSHNSRAGTPVRYINSDNNSLSNTDRKYSTTSSRCESPIRYYENTSSRSTTPIRSFCTPSSRATTPLGSYQISKSQSGTQLRSPNGHISRDSSPTPSIPAPNESILHPIRNRPTSTNNGDLQLPKSRADILVPLKYYFTDVPNNYKPSTPTPQRKRSSSRSRSVCKEDEPTSTNNVNLRQRSTSANRSSCYGDVQQSRPRDLPLPRPRSVYSLTERDSNTLPRQSRKSYIESDSRSSSVGRDIYGSSESLQNLTQLPSTKDIETRARASMRSKLSLPSISSDNARSRKARSQYLSGVVNGNHYRDENGVYHL